MTDEHLALLRDYYTARWRAHLAPKGYRRGWVRELGRATKALMDYEARQRGLAA